MPTRPFELTPAHCQQCFNAQQPIPIRTGAKAGIAFDFPVGSRPPSGTWDKWVRYVQCANPLKRPISGKNLVFEFQVQADPSVEFNWISEGVNNPPDFPAGVTALLKAGPMDNDNVGSLRWFSLQRWVLVNSGLVTFSIPLDPASWFGVNGEDPAAFKAGKDFQAALKCPSFVSLVFGGCYRGHGVNATGPASFNWFDVHVE